MSTLAEKNGVHGLPLGTCLAWNNALCRAVLAAYARGPLTFAPAARAVPDLRLGTRRAGRMSPTHLARKKPQ